MTWPDAWTFWHTIFAPTVGTVGAVTVALWALLRAFQWLWLCVWGIQEQTDRRRVTPIEPSDFEAGWNWVYERDEATG